MSFDFYENVIRWGIAEGVFDSELKRENWGNRILQFFAGDLYEVFPLTQSNFYANELVSGNCSANTLGFSILKHESDSFNVSFSFSCSLSIKTTK